MNKILKNRVSMLKDDLTEKKEKVENRINLLDKYNNTDKLYYNIPLPEDIITLHDNQIGYSHYNDSNKLDQYKLELNYYRHVCEIYDKNNFIITKHQKYGDLYDIEDIEDYYISLKLEEEYMKYVMNSKIALLT